MLKGKSDIRYHRFNIKGYVNVLISAETSFDIFLGM